MFHHCCSFLALVPSLILTGEEIESDMNFSIYATKKEYLRESMYINEYKFQFSYILMCPSMIVIFINKVLLMYFLNEKKKIQ